ncbi:MAG: ferritin-like domain-containing protein [Phycisphaerae bacterium]
MEDSFDSLDVLQIATQLEDAGREFYENLAAHAGVEIIAGLCRTLAEEERRHQTIFQATRNRLSLQSEERLWEPHEYAYLNSLVQTMVLTDLRGSLEAVAGGDVRRLLDLAIQFEKDSILFYAELHEVVGDEHVPAISAIIREEKSHVQSLAEARAAVT